MINTTKKVYFTKKSTTNKLVKFIKKNKLSIIIIGISLSIILLLSTYLYIRYKTNFFNFFDSPFLPYKYII